MRRRVQVKDMLQEWPEVEQGTDRPRHAEEKAVIKFQNHSAPVGGLEVSDLQGAPLSCLWFGPVYFGTSHVQKVILRNNAPYDCNWVCLLQETAAGTEGTDLQKSTDAALLERMGRCSPAAQDISPVLVFVPSQGRLKPNKETIVTVCFSPVCKSSCDEKRDYPASRHDYCLFLLFDTMGSRHGLTPDNGNSSVELAVTGSGIPVSLVPSPSQRFDFLTSVTGQRVDLQCVLHNLCTQLPVTYRFRKLAHFNTKPSTGTIAPGQCQEVVLAFTARQQGSFHVCLKLDVLGHTFQRDGNAAVTTLELCTIHTIPLHLSAVCRCETTHPAPKLNPGITPAVTNPTGALPYVRYSDLPRCRGMVGAAVLSADKTRLHKHGRERSRDTEGEEFVSFPNDRAASIRPASPHRQYRTIFTGVPRYHYVDTDYAFTEEEKERRRQDRQVYTDFIHNLRETRLEIIKERQQENVEDCVDIGIVPAQGLVPPALRERQKISETKSNCSNASPAVKYSPPKNMTPITQQVMSAVPSTSHMVADCNRSLTAQELYQVVIDPLVVDFGEVCVQSVCVQKLKLTNGLPVSVWLQLEVDCSELQGTSPLSQLLPPHSVNTLPLTFQSNNLGQFYRHVSYTVNRKHPGRILVQAEVVPLALELSTTQLVLHADHALLTQSGFRSSVTLRNRYNHAAEFTWKPVVTEKGIMFSVRPATGTVEPYKELDCEVVMYPSYSSSLKGDFDLCVQEGNKQRLHCVAKVGSTTVQLAESRVVFGSVPLNTPSIRTAVLHNTGKLHAFFQVLDERPLQGLVVSPAKGVVPSGGHTTLRIHFNPDSVIKFDTTVEIALKNMRSVTLGVIGSVEPPNVHIGVSHFQFHWLYAGSQRAIPFTLTNQSSAPARVTFDLTENTDFSVHLARPSEKKKQSVNVVEVEGNNTVDCSVVFSPTHAAGYDFELPLRVNGVRWTHQPHRIQATALCAPVEMSPSSLEFHVEPLDPQSDAYTKTVKLKAVGEEEGRAQFNRHVTWRFDCRATAAPTENRAQGELCTVSPSSGSLGPSQSICLTVSINPEAITTGFGGVTKLSLPLYVEDETKGGGDKHKPYRELSIIIVRQLPRITIHPPRILLMPVPLESNATATVTLLASGYPSGTIISAEVDEVELEDGRKIQPISVFFPEGNNIPAENQDQSDPEPNATPLICIVSFCSALPLSLCTNITFTDHLHNRFRVTLCATADNCLLTAWPYMALHHSTQQIVVKTVTGTTAVVLQDYHTQSAASGPASSSSSSFDHNSSTNKNSDSDYFLDSDSVSGQASRNTDVSPNRDAPTNPGIPEFPAADTEEGLYYQNVLLAVERWFSFFGWLSGPHPISVPNTLRRVVSKTQMSPSGGRSYRVIQNIDSRSVVDMLHHLTGKQIPGIPRCHMFPTDVNPRTNQLLRQHEAMLAFLRVQGACLDHIRPAYLLDMEEFKHWCSLQSPEEELGLDYSSVDYESLSKRSWTDVLLQIYKVFVLCRVSVGDLTLTTALNRGDVAGILPVTSEPSVSNIYSSCERRLLSWLNLLYQGVRTTVWGTGGAPSARWIVNFDLDLKDGLVLAAALAAFCPYLIRSHFQRMYTTTSSLEQILHNNIIVAQALNALSLNLDVQPTDLSAPNPVQMLMLCVHLYERLPHFLPLQTITISGDLHNTSSKQVRLKNPSPQPIHYQVLLFGEDAHHFSLPDGSSVTIPPKSSAGVSVQCSCFFLQPMEAFLLLISRSPFGKYGRTLAFNLKTHISRIKPTNTVKCKSPCYKLEVIQVPITNPFNKDGKFSVVLVETPFNPLKPEKRQSLVRQAPSKANTKKTSDKSSGKETEEKCSDIDGEGSEFLSSERNVYLKPGQASTLNISYLPFYTGIKYCSVLLTCPQVGDMVYIVQATAELPLPSPFSARPSPNIVSIRSNSDPAVCVPLLSLHCEVGQVCDELLRVPLINLAWEQALASLGQHHMSAEEHGRRALTHTSRSSTVRVTAACKLFKQQAQLLRDAFHSRRLEYSVEVSLPEYFGLPSIVQIPIKEDASIPWENAAECGCVDIPLRFHADSVGKFICQVVLRSWHDTRVYMLEAQVTSQDKLSSHNDGVQPEFPLRGAEQRTLPVDHVVIQCTVGQTTHAPIHVPNHSRNQVTLKMVTDLSVVSGAPSLVIKPGRSAPYSLTVSSWKRGKQKGVVSFLETDDNQGANRHKGCALGRYEVHFSVEIICQQAAATDFRDVQCAVQSSVAIEIPVKNPGGKLLTLDVYLEGEDLSGENLVSVPPRNTVVYKATFSPRRVGKSTGSVAFHSQRLEGFCCQLELYGLPPPVTLLPKICCQLGKWSSLSVPLVNPTADPLELNVANSNPRNFPLETDPGSALIVEPHSVTQLGVRFRPSSIGEGNHAAKIAFTCPQLQGWCVLLSGRGLLPEPTEPLNIPALIGSSATTTVPFTNPTELPAVLTLTLTDSDPRRPPSSRKATAGNVFSIPLSRTKGVHLGEGASIDVPVVFAPDSIVTQRSWLCIALRPDSSLANKTSSADNMRSGKESPAICWTYPICGVPMVAPVQNSSLGVVHCEAGCQLLKKVVVPLPGCVPVSRVMMEDFQCTVRLDGKTERCLSVSIGAAKRGLHTGIVTLTLNLAYTPLKSSRCPAVISVRYVSGRVWEFPITLISTESQVDDVLIIQANELSFRLTSTTRNPEPFTAAFQPGSSSEVKVIPTSGTLPPVGSVGVLIKVFFTPSANGSHRARLTIQAAHLQRTYEVKGKTAPFFPPICTTSSTIGNSSVRQSTAAELGASETSPPK